MTVTFVRQNVVCFNLWGSRNGMSKFSFIPVNGVKVGGRGLLVLSLLNDAFLQNYFWGLFLCNTWRLAAERFSFLFQHF